MLPQTSLLEQSWTQWFTSECSRTRGVRLTILVKHVVTLLTVRKVEYSGVKRYRLGFSHWYHGGELGTTFLGTRSPQQITHWDISLLKSDLLPSSGLIRVGAAGTGKGDVMERMQDMPSKLFFCTTWCCKNKSWKLLRLSQCIVVRIHWKEPEANYVRSDSWFLNTTQAYLRAFGPFLMMEQGRPLHVRNWRDLLQG